MGNLLINSLMFKRLKISVLKLGNKKGLRKSNVGLSQYLLAKIYGNLAKIGKTWDFKTKRSSFSQLMLIWPQKYNCLKLTYRCLTKTILIR